MLSASRIVAIALMNQIDMTQIAPRMVPGNGWALQKSVAPDGVLKPVTAPIPLDHQASLLEPNGTETLPAAHRFVVLVS